MNAMAFAISSGVPMRLLGTCASRKFALFSFVCAKWLNILVSTGPGPTMLTRTPVPASRLRDAFHGVLTANIRGRARATDFAVGRRDVNDAAFALPKHRPNLVLHAEKHTKYICVEDGFVVLGVRICSGLGIAHGAGVIDGNVEASETSDDLVNEVFDFLFMPHIGTHKFGFSAEFAKLSGKLLPFIVVTSGNNDPRSFLREGLGCGPTYACQGSGN